MRPVPASLTMALSLDFWGPILAGAAGATATWQVARISLRAPAPRPGWRQVAPSAMHWLGLVGAGGIVCLMAWVGLFIGSARADAEFQMRMLWLLVGGFSLSAMVCAWQMRAILRAGVSWRGSQITFAGPTGAPLTRNMAQVIGMRRPWFGSVRIAFDDGNEIRLDPHATNVPELWDRILEANGG